MNFDYEVFEQDETIEISNFDEKDPSKSFTIGLYRFWDWVESTGLNQWCNDYYDASQYDGHGQDTGKFTMDEYFDTVGIELVKEDMAKYIKAELGIDIS